MAKIKLKLNITEYNIYLIVKSDINEDSVKKQFVDFRKSKPSLGNFIEF